MTKYIGVKGPAKKSIGDEKPKTDFCVDDQLWSKISFRIPVYSLTLVVATAALSQLFGYQLEILYKPWYWIGILSVIVIALIKIIRNERAINIPYKLCIVAVVISVVMIGVSSIDPRWNIKYGVNHLLGKSEIQTVKKNAPLYIIKNGVFTYVRDLEEDTEVKVINWDISDKKEIFNESQLPIKNDVYPSGRIYYIPARWFNSFSKEASNYGPKADFTLKKGDKLTYQLGLNEATPWIEIPKGVIYNIDQKNFRVFYSTGQVVDVGEKDVILPDIKPTKIRVGSLMPGNIIQITGM